MCFSIDNDGDNAVVRQLLLFVLLAFAVPHELRGEATIREEQEAAKAAGIQLPDSVAAVEAKYDRFPNGGPTVVGVFKWDQEDWSGVGHRAGGYQWATLVAGKFFVTAHHTRVQNEMIFYFFHGHDRKVYSRQVVEADQKNPRDELVTHRIAGTDLALGRFQESVGNNFATYPVFVRQEIPATGSKGVNPYSEFRDELVIVGQAAAPPDDAYEDGMEMTHLDPVSQKYGTNTANATPQSNDGSSIPFMFEEVDNPAEYLPRIFSSGGASFKLIDRRPAVAGVHGRSISYDVWKLNVPILDTILSNDGYPRTKDHMAQFHHVAIGFHRNEMDAAISAQQRGIPGHEKQVIVYYTMDKDGNHVAGDYNGNFARDGGDLDIMLREVRMRRTQNRGYNWYLDWNSDRKIDNTDATHLIQEVFGTRLGDLDLDGDVDSTDDQRLTAFLGTTHTRWVSGDLNGDGKTDQTDRRILRRSLRSPARAR